MRAFGRYVAKWSALTVQVDATVLGIRQVSKTQIGAKKVQFEAVTELDTFEKVMSFKEHPDYVDVLNELGHDESKMVKRISGVITGQTRTLIICAAFVYPCCFNMQIFKTIVC